MTWETTQSTIVDRTDYSSEPDQGTIAHFQKKKIDNIFWKNMNIFSFQTSNIFWKHEQNLNLLNFFEKF